MSAARLDHLRSSQNADGGWGYFPGKASWFEPTAYAVLALHGLPQDRQRIEKAAACLLSWQRPDGGFPAAARLPESSWVTALAVTVMTVMAHTGRERGRAVAWLLDQKGSEKAWFTRIASRMGLLDPGRPIDVTGWPWLQGTSSWVEPTAQALVALKIAGVAHARVAEGEAQLLGVRCRDGGWNYGSPRALQIDLPSYAETTAVALLGLQGVDRKRIAGALEQARRLAVADVSRMARAWLGIALRNWDLPPPLPPAERLPAGGDILVTALETLAAGENWKLLGVRK
jgi:hypothetical protein